MSEYERASIESNFADDDGGRTQLMEQKRLCSHLTLPQILPPQEWTTSKDANGESLPRSFQSRGMLGTRSLVGQLLIEIFPPGMAFWITRMKDEYQSRFTEAMINAANGHLLQRDLAVLCLLENAGHDEALPKGFRTRTRQAIEAVCCVGDTLIRGNSDYTQTVFRLDNYVVKRNDAGQPVYYITRECKDVKYLGDTEKEQAERFAKSKLAPSILDKPCKEREMKLFTRVEYQPFKKSWVITQEINKHDIHTYERKVCNYISVPVNLSPGDNYGHGFAESWESDLFTADRLRKRFLEWTAAASRILPVIDRGSNIRPEMLSKTPNGFPIFGGRVEGGVVGDVGFIQTGKMQDFQVVKDVAGMIDADLDRSMLTGIGQVRQSERTTAFEVSEVTLREKEASVGSFFSDIADTMQPQIVRWAFDEAARNGDVPSLNRAGSTTDYEAMKEHVVMTGYRALSERAKAGKLAQIPILANQIGEAAVSRIKGENIITDIVRLQGIDPSRYVKTNQEIESETQSALQTQAAQQAIASTGAVAESYGDAAAKAQFAQQ